MRRFTVRLSPELHAALQRAAAAETRTEADQVRHYVTAGLRGDGYLSPPLPPRAPEPSK